MKTWNEECKKEKEECLKLLRKYEQYNASAADGAGLEEGKAFYEDLFGGAAAPKFDSIATVAQKKDTIRQNKDAQEAARKEIMQNGRNVEYCMDWKLNRWDDTRNPRKRYFYAAMQRSPEACINALLGAELPEAPYMVDYRRMEAYCKWLEEHYGWLLGGAGNGNSWSVGMTFSQKWYRSEAERNKYMSGAIEIYEKLRRTPVKKDAAYLAFKMNRIRDKCVDEARREHVTASIPTLLTPDKVAGRMLDRFTSRHAILTLLLILAAIIGFLYGAPRITKDWGKGWKSLTTAVDAQGESGEAAHLRYSVSEEGEILDVKGLKGVTSWAIPQEIDGIRITDIGWDRYSPPEGLEGVKVIQLPSGMMESSDYKNWKSEFAGLDLETLVFSAGTKEIISDAFRGWKTLQKVVLPEDLTTLGSSAFADCTALSEVVFPAEGSILQAGANVFANTAWYNRMLQQDRYVLGGGVLFAADPSQKEWTPPAGTVVIADEVCTHSGYIRVFIPDGVKTIGREAFVYSKKLEGVSLPDGLISIEASAFQGCGELTQLEFRGSVEVIGRSAFENCNKIVSLALPEGLTVIGDRAFVDGKTAEVSFPSTLQEIGEHAFANFLFSSRLQSVILPEGLTTVAHQAFYGRDIGELSLPSSLIYVGAEAFGKLPGSREENGMLIKDGILFQYKGNEAAVSIPDGVRAIAGKAFQRSGSLESVDIPDGVLAIGDSAFENRRELAEVNLPGTLEIIGASAFKGCSALSAITLPDSVTEIGASAFQSSGLTIVRGGARVAVVGENAFLSTNLPTETMERFKALSDG